MLSTISFSSNSKKSYNIHFNHPFFQKNKSLGCSRQKQSIEVNYCLRTSTVVQFYKYSAVLNCTVHIVFKWIFCIFTSR